MNKGEARNALARAVFFNRLGELRDRTYENQQHRASGLNLVVAAIALWNTVYLEPAIRALQERSYVCDQQLLAHLSPLKWEHRNLTEDYHWRRDGGLTKEVSAMAWIEDAEYNNFFGPSGDRVENFGLCQASLCRIACPCI